MTFISLAAVQNGFACQGQGVLGKRIRSIKQLASIQDDWREGWRQLGDGHKWKLFGDYWRNQNVDTTRDGPTIEHGLPLTPEAITKSLFATVTNLSTTSFRKP
jgi:hypothetical protein